MTTEDDPLELPATTRRVRAIARGAQLSDAALTRALELATESPGPTAWRVFLSRTLAILGACLLLSAVVSLVAYNWDRIGRFGKFALLDVAIAVAAILAWRLLPRFSGEIALFAAAVLVGPLLALFGQTYQTGADPYGLFLMWWLITLPWVSASRFSGTWVLSLALIQLSIVLYWTQVIAVRDTKEVLYVPLLISAIDFAALAVWEWQRRREPPWLTERWAQRVVAVFGLYALWIAAVVFVLVDDKSGVAGVIALLAFVAAVAAMLQYYGRVQRDRFMVTIAVVAAMALVTAFVGRVVFDLMKLGLQGALLMAAFVVWEITLGLKWYRRLPGAA